MQYLGGGAEKLSAKLLTKKKNANVLSEFGK